MNQMNQFCRAYTDKIFSKYDRDNSNVIDRQELKYWLRDQIKKAPLTKDKVKQGFMEFVSSTDKNGDGKIDRWEMYEYCLEKYNPEE